MRILLIADFRRDHPRQLLNNPRKFSKGLVRNGHDVLEFSYKDELLALSPFRSKKFAQWCAKEKTDDLLLVLSKHYQPEVILIMAFKLLDAETIQRLKQAHPSTPVMCWYCDMYAGIDPKIAPLAKECHWFLATAGGDFLKAYKDLGIEHCAFLPNPCDGDIEYPREVPPSFHTKMLFTGKLMHGQGGQDAMRSKLIQELVDKKGMTVWGCLGRPGVEGIEYLQAICGTRIALSINAFNDIPCYHSDRLTHYLGCGAFVLAKYVPGSERLFEDRRHLDYFRTSEECLDRVDYYLEKEEERRRIAQQGYEHIHANFSGQILARRMIDLIQTGRYDPPWGEVL